MKNMRSCLLAMVATATLLLSYGCGSQTGSDPLCYDVGFPYPTGGACGLSVPTTSDTSGTVTAGTFTVDYYNNTSLVASETVQRPAINYAYADFHGIDSATFHAVWTGNIVVANGLAPIDINFDVHWSDVSLFIDDLPVASWSNSNRVVPYVFSPGTHKVVIKYFNHWHTTDFNTSFTTNTMHTKDEAKPLLTPLIDSNTRIVYVGAYESGDLYQNTTVTLNSTTSKVFLFLTSYESMNWVIDNPNNVTIAGIVYSSYSTVSTVTASADVPTFEVASLAYGYSNFTGPSADILSLTGRAPDYTYGAYTLTSQAVSAP